MFDNKYQTEICDVLDKMRGGFSLFDAFKACRNFGISCDPYDVLEVINDQCAIVALEEIRENDKTRYYKLA